MATIIHRPEEIANHTRSTKLHLVKECGSGHADSIGCLLAFPLCASLQGTVKPCGRKTASSVICTCNVWVQTQIICNLAVCRQSGLKNLLCYLLYHCYRYTDVHKPLQFYIVSIATVFSVLKSCNRQIKVFSRYFR